MAWCLTKDNEAKFRAALLNKEINPLELSTMGSEKRRALFEKYVTPDNAIRINSLYESKLLLKNQVTGFERWAKRSLGMSPQIKRDLMSKIDKLREQGVIKETQLAAISEGQILSEKEIKEYDSLSKKELNDFKEDLVRTRLGLNINLEQAQTISKMSKESADSRKIWQAKLDSNVDWSVNPHKTRKEWINNTSRIGYGLKQVVIEKYVNDIKSEAKKRRILFKEDPIRALLTPVKDATELFSNLFKSLMTSIDNSFFGRQGISNLYGTIEQKKIWGRNFKKSFGDIGAELIAKKINGFGAMDFIKADIYSRPNAMNGKYKVGGYELDVLTEEVFPTSLPERVWLVGRLFKASETTFNGAALRMRADLADMYISQMEAQGGNALDPEQARGIGNLVGSLTGRGNIGRASPMSKELNLLFWSVKFFKSSIDILTMHKFDSQATDFTRAEAQRNLINIVAHVGGLMILANLIDPESVEEDPRSTNFGKIRVYGKWINITAGLGGLVVLAARVSPSIHNGEWGHWRKSSSGNWTNLQAGGFGVQNTVQVIMDAIFLNKLAPMASIIRDYYEGEMFGGEPFDITKAIINSGTPLIIQAGWDVKDEKFGVILGVLIAEFFGTSVSDYQYTSNWGNRISKEMVAFKDQVGEEKFKLANESYDRAYNIWLEQVMKTNEYKILSDDDKQTLKTQARDALKDRIMKEVGYRKLKSRKTLQERRDTLKIKTLLP